VAESSNFTECEKDHDRASFCNTLSICAKKYGPSCVKMTMEKNRNSTSAAGGGFDRSKEHKAVHKSSSKSFHAPTPHHIAQKVHICLRFLSWEPMAHWRYCTGQSFQPNVHMDTERAENIWYVIY